MIYERFKLDISRERQCPSSHVYIVYIVHSSVSEGGLGDAKTKKVQRSSTPNFNFNFNLSLPHPPIPRLLLTIQVKRTALSNYPHRIDPNITPLTRPLTQAPTQGKQKRDPFSSTSTMSELPTSQAFLEQSALLLEAYPDTVRQTEKFPPRGWDLQSGDDGSRIPPHDPQTPISNNSEKKEEANPPKPAHNNKILLPNHNAGRKTQARQIRSPQSCQSRKDRRHNSPRKHTRNNGTNTSRASRSPRAENLQPHRGDLSQVPHKQGRGGGTVDYGPGETGGRGGCG